MERQHALQMQQKRNLPAGAVLLLAFATVMFHAMLLFLFKPIQKDSRPLRSRSHHTVICKPEDLADRDIHQLNYWLKYTEPENFVKPNDEHGFSLVREMRYYDFQQPRMDSPGLFHLAAGTSTAPPDDSSAPVRELAVLNSRPEIPLKTPQIKDPETAAVQYPVWSDLKGNQFYGLFLNDDASRKILEKNKADSATMLTYLPAKEENMPPLIRILRSCGNTALDLLAERQLALYAAEKALKGQNLFLVTWNKPVPAKAETKK